MPSYIGYRPQFEPISLQEYLTVPMMILEGRQKEADKIEQYQNEAEKYRAMMGDSPEAQSIWAAYDNALNNLGDDILNNKTGDLTRAAKKIGDSFRNIKYKAEEAQKALDEDTKRFANNPNLIGKPADFITYYNDPHYRATAVNGKDIQDAVSAFADSYASTLPVENRGYVDPTTKHDILYERGLTPEQKNMLYQDALSENPQTSEGATLRQTLQTAGIDLSNPEAVSLASRYIENGMRPLDRKGFTQTNPLFRTSGQQASDNLAWMKVKEARQSLPQEWDDVDEYDTTDTKSKRYKYRQRKDSSGRIFIERSPLIKKNGKWIPEKGNDWWQPAPEYKRDGVPYKESISGTGLYGDTQTASNTWYDNVQITYGLDAKGNFTNDVEDASIVLDDNGKRYKEVNEEDKKQRSELSIAKRAAKLKGYGESQCEFRWDSDKKRIITIITGQPQPKKSSTDLARQALQNKENGQRDWVTTNG